MRHRQIEWTVDNTMTAIEYAVPCFVAATKAASNMYRVKPLEGGNVTCNKCHQNGDIEIVSTNTDFILSLYESTVESCRPVLMS